MLRHKCVSYPFLRFLVKTTVLLITLAAGGTGLWAQVAAPGEDVYGGSTALACPLGVAPHFYTQKIGNQWWLCTPAGNVFWLRSVYHVDGNDDVADYQGITLRSVLTAKYGNSSTRWGPPTVRKLRSWGFNATAEYSSIYVQPTTVNSDWAPDWSIPEKMPFMGLLWPAHYARNRSSYPGVQPVKELVGATKTSVYTGLRRKCPDLLDPNYVNWLINDLRDFRNPEYNWVRNSRNDYLIGLNVDETDEMFGFGAGPEFKGFTGGVPEDYAHVHLGWIVLVTPSTQSSGTDANGNPITYTDTKVYSKQALSDWLSVRYFADITRLNLAWGSTYTTFGTSGGWGTGTGVLDEDGTHSWVPRDFIRLADANPIVAQDLDDFLLFFAQQYFSAIRGVLATEAPGILYLGPTNMGSWGAPPRQQILQAAGDYVDVLGLSPTPTLCYSCPDEQARIDYLAMFGGDLPWISWETTTAQPDSYMSPFPIPDSFEPDATTQALRGQRYQAMITKLLNARDSLTLTYHNVGFKWWQYYDGRAQRANWGLVTPRDNAYDGSAVISQGVDAWGYPTGGERANYGDFLSTVRLVNQNIYPSVIPPRP